MSSFHRLQTGRYLCATGEDCCVVCSSFLRCGVSHPAPRVCERKSFYLSMSFLDSEYNGFDACKCMSKSTSRDGGVCKTAVVLKMSC